MALTRLTIVREPLSLDALAAEIEGQARDVREGCGAVVTFLGVVRAHHRGRRVRYLEYEAFDGLALRVFDQIDAEVREQWPAAVLGLRHRVGRLAVGDASVAVAAAAAHRAEAFQACRYAIERVKQIAPIWKHEFFDDGSAWVEGAPADPTDLEARRTALARACV
jgi:molybdopterin synthase catalytic subunit